MHFTTFITLATVSLGMPLLHERDAQVHTVTDLDVVTVTSYVTLWIIPASTIGSASQPLPTPNSITPVETQKGPLSSTTYTALVPSQTTVRKDPPPPSSASNPQPVATSTTVPPAQSSAPTSVGQYPVERIGDASAMDGPCTPGQLCSGDITHFNPSMGVGACGYKDWNTKSIWLDTDLVVAASANIMGSFGNGGTPDDVNELCKRSVHIKAQDGGQDVVARVVDKCPTCPGNFDLDLSPKVFDMVAPKGDGRVHNVEWFWV